MRLYIPELGTGIILAADWTFTVINERRNASLAPLMGGPKERVKPWRIEDNRPADEDARQMAWASYSYPFGVKKNPNYTPGDWREPRYKAKKPGKFTIPAGVTLTVDRIYIRQGNKEFSSVTFKTKLNDKIVRFFAKLDDVNNIEF